MKKKLITLFLVLSVFSFSENIIRKISVTGNSEREIMPDTANVTFQINVKNRNLNTATKEANEKIEKFKSALKARKIILSEFETISFYSRKQKEYNDENEIIYQNYDEDSKNIGNRANVKPDKKPSSYTGNLSILIKNTDFNQISGLIEFSDGENLQSIQKDFNNGTFAFNISETDTSPDKALNRILTKFNSVKAKLQSLGISSSNIMLGEYTFTENYNDRSAEYVDLFYVVHDFRIKMNDIKNLNTVISIADDIGININGNINFDISNKDKIASEMYNDAFNQAQNKAESILKSSSLKLASPLVVSEDVEFQQKMIDQIDDRWSLKRVSAPVALEESTSSNFGLYSGYSKERASIKIDYTPKPIKLVQKISVLYEMK